MKTPIFLMGFLLLGSTFLAHGEAQERTSGPCFSVNVQNDPVNTATVVQSCDRNFSRTVQAGGRNVSSTTQSGRVNDNKARQYWFDRMEYLGRIRHD
jgi:hypothetical protein